MVHLPNMRTELINLFKQAKNELDKACYAHDAAYSYFKDINNRTAADKILIDKAYEIA